MKELDKEETNTFLPKDEQRAFLSSNKNGLRCSSLGFIPNNSNTSDNKSLEFLAEIIADAFINNEI